MINSLRWLNAVLVVAVFLSPGLTGSEPEGGRPLEKEAGRPEFWDPIPDSPSTRMPLRIQDDYWRGQFERVSREVSVVEKPSVVFFGDSITWHWSLGARTGEAIWKERFLPSKAINMGNSGDITPVMLYRVSHGNLGFSKDAEPEVAVLLCGTNNFVVKQSAGGKVRWDLGADCPPQEVAHGVRAIAQVFRRRLPSTRVIMLGVLPVANSAKWARCQQVNAFGASTGYDANEVVFVDLQDQFLGSDGKLAPGLFTDGTHLTEEGYRVWADAIEPIAKAMKSKPPLDPLKVMLIGGSVTAGADSAGSYRRYLDGMLRRKGLLIDFIGSRRRHGDEEVEPDSYEFDVDHEGHWQKTAGWLATQMPSILGSEVPDVAVLHLGADAVQQGQASSVRGAEEVAAKVEVILESLRAKNPTVKVALAKIAGIREKDEQVALMNRELQRLGEKVTTPESPVVIADLNADVDLEEDLAADGVLPSPQGAKKMAGVFAGAIERLVDEESP